MATNYTANDSMNYAKRFVGSLPVDDTDLKLRILNDAATMMHLYANWSWTVSSIAEDDIVDEQSDYDVTLTNNLYLLRANIVDPDGENIAHVDPTHSIVAGSRIKGVPTQVSLVDSDTIRFYPTPNGLPASTKFHLFYKTKPTQITAGNVSTASTLDFPDEWHWVYNEIVLLKALRFSSNELEGGVQSNSQGQFVYSGQWGVVMAALEFMRAREKPFLYDTGEPQNG